MADLRITLRAVESEMAFGSPFVPAFELMDLFEKPSVIPDFGVRGLLIVFFRTEDCAKCLQDLSLLQKAISDKIPMVGVALSNNSINVRMAIQKYEIPFPVYLAPNSPFRFQHTPSSVLVDKYRNVRHLAAVDLMPVEQIIQEVQALLERG